MTRDEENLRPLSIFHYIVAGISCLFMIFPAAYLVSVRRLFGIETPYPPVVSP